VSIWDVSFEDVRYLANRGFNVIGVETSGSDISMIVFT